MYTWSKTKPKTNKSKQKYKYRRISKARTLVSGKPYIINSCVFSSGTLIQILSQNNITNSLSYNNTLSLCKQKRSHVVSRQIFTRAQHLKLESCVCGWLEGSEVESLTEETVPVYQSAQSLETFDHA